MKQLVQVQHKKANKRLMRNRIGARDTKRASSPEDGGAVDILLGMRRVSPEKVEELDLQAVEEELEWLTGEEPEYDHDDWRAFEKELEDLRRN